MPSTKFRYGERGSSVADVVAAGSEAGVHPDIKPTHDTTRNEENNNVWANFSLIVTEWQILRFCSILVRGFFVDFLCLKFRSQKIHRFDRGCSIRSYSYTAPSIWSLFDRICRRKISPLRCAGYGLTTYLRRVCDIWMVGRVTPTRWPRPNL